MKKLFYLVVTLLVIALIFPLANLVRSGNVSADLTARVTDPNFRKLAPAYQYKCSDCHLPGADPPFYSGFPIAGDMMRKDVTMAIEHVDMAAEFFDGAPHFSEAVLAKTQKVIQDDSMPPFRYRALHWKSALTEQEKKDSFTWIRQARARANGAPNTDDPIYNEAVLPLVVPAGLNREKAALGNRLFHDVRLSRDNTLSCASCHDLAKGGTDQAQFSDGINGQIGPINSPTVFNSVYALAQFWDGRAADLNEQASGPVNNPIEMGSNWEEVLGKLKDDKEYAAAFEAIYPDGMTSGNITDAIAGFEESLVTTNSRFDHYLLGNADALTAEERQGYDLFRSYGCATCHAGQAMGGSSFEKMGVYGDYFAGRGTEIKDADHGRYNVTKQERDRQRFKVPTLRNIALTHPYFHDGSVSDLHEAVKMMARYQTDRPMTENDAHVIRTFLLTLTGEYEGRLLK